MKYKRNGGMIQYVAVLVVGILVAMLLPIWLCFSIIVGLLVFISFFI